MKRVYQSSKYKRYNKRRSRRKHKRHRNYILWRKKKRKSELGLPLVILRQRRKLRHKFRGYVEVKAPDNFSFLSNPEGVNSLINKLNILYEAKKKAFVSLDLIHTIDYGAILVLLSIMVKFKSRRIPFDGSFPLAPDIRDHLERSGFFENLYNKFVESDRYTLVPRSNQIHTHAWKDVDSELSSSLISAASKTIWGSERRCQGVQRVLIELMMNTNNHATINQVGDKHWWLSVNHCKVSKRVYFSFVDYGVGVFESLKHKRVGNKFHNWKERLSKRFKYGGNDELLKLILSGKLHETVTNKYWRGKGLPGIADALNRNHISNLHIITNNVYARVSEGTYNLMRHPFSGTFIYFELGESNENCK